MRGTTLAKAYVQILPSSEGMQGKLSEIMNKEGSSAGKSAGLLAGQNLAAKLKTVITAAGIGKALSSAITQGAAMQQSLGGVETLFKDSANKVIENAQNAYKTAGMSANQYMETVTGFSASLLQGLGGDTEKAADVADMALTDMSDNTNKMGTSMELIQNAYQGFAKQNYTMLDNLKLGYGGTQTEMQRLLADAEKISGVKYDISNLGDVYSAIHVIQQEMGIAGTTALEASTTFSGAFAAMKGSAQTFLGNLALGESVWPSFVAMLQTTKTFLIDNFLPMLGNIVVSISEVIRQTAKNILESDGSVVNSIITAINTRLPNILQRGVVIISNIAKGILQNLPKIIEVAGTTVSKFVTCIINNLPKVLSSGVKLIVNLVNGVINNLPKIVTAASTTVAKLVSSILTNAPKLLSSGITLIGKLAAGLLKAVPSLIASIPSIVKSITSAFTSIEWGNVGVNIIKGIARGILNGVGSIINAAKEAAASALAAAKDALGIHSPSRRFEYEVGAMVPPGIAGGITKNAATVKRAMKSLSEEVLGIANQDYSDAIKNMTSAPYVKASGLGYFEENLVQAITTQGERQAKAIERGLSRVKLTSNNRELGRFLCDLGFARG